MLPMMELCIFSMAFIEVEMSSTSFASRCICSCARRNGCWSFGAAAIMSLEALEPARMLLAAALKLAEMVMVVLLRLIRGCCVAKCSGGYKKIIGGGALKFPAN